MSTGQKILWAIIIVVIVIGAYWWWSSSQSASSTQAIGTNSGAPFIPASATQSQTQPGATNTGATNSVGTNVSVSAGASTNNNSVPKTAKVIFNGSSFSPASVTIAQGGTVTWTSTNGPFWIASAPHPIHNGYDGTTMQQHCAPGYAGATPFDQCAGGTAYSYTFNKVGTWDYHDHLDASITGSVKVVAQ